MGFTPSPMVEADLIVVNACTVTEGAERDSRRYITNCGKNNREATIILTGCHGQAYPEKGFGAHAVIGQAEKMEIEKYLDKRGIFVSGRDDLSIERVRRIGQSSDKTRQFLKIQDGCNRFCAYCIIPYARGMPRSRPLSDIMDMLKDLKQGGTKEVVITGIELSEYCDPASSIDFKAYCLISRGMILLREYGSVLSTPFM